MKMPSVDIACQKFLDELPTRVLILPADDQVVTIVYTDNATDAPCR